jgi:hypothetical protein
MITGADLPDKIGEAGHDGQHREHHEGQHADNFRPVNPVLRLPHFNVVLAINQI